MAEYITRKAVFEQFDNGEADVIEMYPDGSVDFGFGASNIRDLINAIPAADVAPVVHGTWELRHGSWYCSNCGRGYKIKFGVAPACKHNYCPNCGARMDGGSDAKAD